MGNFTSCLYAESNTAKLIDLHRNILRIVDLPITAAELMLEDPGHVISPAVELGRNFNFRLTAMKADENLCKGRVYILIPVSKVNRKLCESEMAAIKSACRERQTKRRSSRVLPEVNEIAGEGTDLKKPVDELLEEGNCEIGKLSYRTRQWKPALEPIYERY